MRNRSVLLPIACALGAAAVCQEPSESDLVLLQPYVDRTRLGSGIDAYQAEDRVLVPLGELCRLLGFAIRVDPSGRSATGSFLIPKRSFRLDLDKGLVEVEGRRWPMPRVAPLNQELYVDARSLADWFPMAVKVDLKGSALVLQPKEKLPVQEIWERENRYGTLPPNPYGEDDGLKGLPRPVP